MGVYEDLGVRPFINAVAAHTRFGGSIMPDPVVRAMTEAARQSVDLRELQEAAGRAIAALTRNQACYVSCGAASGLQLAVAACIAGTDEELARRLPRAGDDVHVVMLRSQGGTEADTAIRNTGAAIRLVDDSRGSTAGDLASAVDRDTVAVVMLDWQGDGVPEIAEVVRAAHARGVPVLVDAADGVPPASGFWRYTRDCGADAVVISGGKGLRGPQNTGLVLGSREIVDGCGFLGSPNDRFGRTMKVSKEAIVGVHAAVKHFLACEREMAEAASEQVEALVRDLSELDSVSVHPEGGEVVVRLRAPRPTDAEIRTRLLEGDPSVLAFCRDGVVRINVAILQPGQERLVAGRLRQLLG